MKLKKTARGFAYYEFKDNNGINCTLQKSSSALTDKIWLGADAEIKEFYPPPRETDEAWFDVTDLSPLKHRPENEIHVFSRMHLVESGSILFFYVFNYQKNSKYYKKTPLKHTTKAI